MERRTKLWAAKSAAILLAIPFLIYAYEYGPDAGVAGVPGEAGTCNQAGCHTGTPVNGGGGSVAVSFPNGLSYSPGVTQQLVVTITDPAMKRWGFELTARTQSDVTQMAGTFSPTDKFTQLICDTPADLGIWTKEVNPVAPRPCPANLPLAYIEHTLGGYQLNQNSPAQYTFAWTPPATDVGPVTIYVAGNAGPGGIAQNLGCHIYTATYTLTTTSAAPQPAISSAGVVNAASLAAPGMPNSAIAQGSIFTINGSNLGPPAAVQSGLPLQTSLGGTSVQVTVNGASLAAPIVAVSATQVTAIMPSGIAVGSGTVTVGTSGQTSAAAAVQVTSANFGIYTLNGAGSGPAQVTDANGNAVTLANPAQPGATVTLAGTGLGPISADDVSQPSMQDVSPTVALFVGSEPATPQYSGRSGQAPGQDAITFTVPADAITGCYVPLSVMVNNTVSNFASIAVAPAGSACSDGTGWQASQVQQIQAASGNPRVGTISFTRLASGGVTTDSGSATFGNYTASQLAGSLGPFQMASTGGCLVFPVSGTAASVTDPVQPQGLNAGSAVGISGANGSAQLTAPSGAATGIYRGLVGSSANGGKLYLDPGAYTIGGTAGDIGAIQGQFNMPAPVTWTNAKTLSSIDRSQGFTATWTGGDPSSFVNLSGSSSGAMFTCTAAASAGTFTVPPAVTQALPASGSGQLMLLQVAPSASFTAPGIDIGVATGSTGVSQAVAFQ